MRQRQKTSLSRDPQNISNDLWYYEEKSGIAIYHEIRDGNGHGIRTINVTIPWKNLIRTVNRYRKYRHDLTVVWPTKGAKRK